MEPEKSPTDAAGAPKKLTGTMEEYAALRGLNYNTVRGYVATKQVVMVDVDVTNIKPMFGESPVTKRLVDFAATDARLAETRKPRKNGAGEKIQMGNAEDVEYRKNFALARRREIELEELEGKMVRADEVKEAWVKTLTTVKTGVLRIPDRTSQQVAASTDLREVRAILERECENVLKGIHDELVAAGL